MGPGRADAAKFPQNGNQSPIYNAWPNVLITRTQKAHTAGNLVKMRGSSDEETDAGRPCWGRDVDGGLGQARDKGPKDAAVTRANHTSFSETKEPDHSQDSSLSEDETKRISY